MPLFSDFSLVKYEDGVLTIELSPPIPVGGMFLTFTMNKRMGGRVPLLTRSCGSGYGGGESGITVVNSGIGVVAIDIDSNNTSGLVPYNYACQLERMDPGNETVLWQGYMILGQNVRG